MLDISASLPKDKETLFALARMYTENTREKEAAARAETSLREFVKEAWHVVEPSTEFVPGWHLDAICDHLQAITDGTIKNLIINVPPRTAKSLCVSVFWPAWEWISHPEQRWLFMSYSSVLSIRDSVKCRRLIQSPWYQRHWKNKYKLQGDQNAKERYENDKTGHRIASSVRGLGTGEGGNRIVCFPAHEPVHTKNGLVPIGEFVANRSSDEVLSLDPESGKMVWIRPTGWHTNPGRKTVRVSFRDGSSLECTADHRLLTDAGMVQAQQLVPGSSVSVVDLAQPLGYASPGAPLADVLNGSSFDSVTSSQDIGAVAAANYLNGLISGQHCSGSIFEQRKRSVPLGVFDVLGASSIFEIIKSGVNRVSVFVSDLLSGWARSNEGFYAKLVNEPIGGFPIPAKAYAGVSFIGAGFEDFSRNNDYGSGAARCFSRKTFDSAEAGHQIQRESNNLRPSFAVVESVSSGGFCDEAFCITVPRTHNFCIGRDHGYIVANCDDPHNADEAESDIIRQGVLDWWDGTMATRSNDPKVGARVIVMQRLHESDLSGHILANGNFEHLVLPMRYENDLKSHTSLDFVDPRSTEGELLWKERFGEKEVSDIEKALGSARTAGQLQQRPSPGEGGMFKKHWWKYWQPRGTNLPAIPVKMPSGKIELREAVTVPDYFGMAIQSWDAAFKDTKTSDFTAGLVIGGNGADRYILDCEYDRMDLPATLDAVRRLSMRWPNAHLKLVEDKANGPAVIQSLRHEIGGLVEVNPEGGKVARANAAAPSVESGNWYLPHPALAPWVEKLISQAAAFPAGANDDLVDALSQGCIRLLHTTPKSAKAKKPYQPYQPTGERSWMS